MDFEKRIGSITKDRLNWESHWQEIANRCLTESADFNVTRSQGERRDDLVFDPTTTLAVNKSASAILGLMTPDAQRWHNLSTDNDELNKDREVKKYFDEVTNILFAQRYAAASRFPTSNYESLRSLMAFGTGAMAIMEDPSGRGIVYRSIFLGDSYVDVNSYGKVDTFARKICWTKAQAKEQFDESKLPDKLKQADDCRKFDFYHLVYPNPDYVPLSIRPEERQYKFAYLLADDLKKPIEEGGYYEFPYAVARDVTSPIEVYGRSPAMHLLPEIKGLNEMRKTNIRGAHMSVLPPLLAPSQGNLGAGGLGAGGIRVNMQPGSVTMGGVNANGQQLIHPLQTGARPDIGQQAIEESRKIINDGFLLNLFQILVETPAMTATEVLARTQEKGVLLAPVANRLQSDYLGVSIERELDILERQMLLPEPPGVLLEAGGEYSIKYDSPLTKAQRSEEVIAMDETVQVASQAAAYKPDIMDRIDLDEYIKERSDIRGVPAKIIRGDEDVEAIRQSRQEQEQEQQMLQEAPALAGAAKDIAQAQSM